jgi:hypothetical protein
VARAAEREGERQGAGGSNVGPWVNSHLDLLPARQLFLESNLSHINVRIQAGARTPGFRSACTTPGGGR